MDKNKIAPPYLAFREFARAISEESLDSYPEIILKGGEGGYMTLEDAMGIFFIPKISNVNNWLAHKNPNAEGVSRDRRILHWLQMCEALGGRVETALERAAKHMDTYNRGVRLLLSSQYDKTLHWYKERGLEKGLRLGGNDTRPTNLASIAVYRGYINKAWELTKEDDLMYSDVLWRRCLHKSNINQCCELAKILFSKGKTPPSGLMDLVAHCQINEGNKKSVMDFIDIVLPYENPNWTCQGSSQNLINVIYNFRSTASLDLIKIFLDLGADPLYADKTKNPNTTAMEVILEKWVGSSVRSHMRQPLWEAFELISERTSADKVLSYLTNKKVEKTTRELSKKSTSNSPWTDEEIDREVDKDISRLKKYILDLRSRVPERSGENSKPQPKI